MLSEDEERRLLETKFKDYDIIDDSKMPSAEEAKKIVISKELREELDKSADEISRKFGLL